MLNKSKVIKTALLLAITTAGICGCTRGVPDFAFRSKYEIKSITAKEIADAASQGQLSLSYKNLPGEMLQKESIKVTQKFVDGGNTAIYAFPLTLADGETKINIPAYKNYTLESIVITFNYKTVGDNSIHQAQADINIRDDANCSQPGCAEITWWNADKFHNNEEITFQKGLIAKANFTKQNIFFIRGSSQGTAVK